MRWSFVKATGSAGWAGLIGLLAVMSWQLRTTPNPVWHQELRVLESLVCKFPYNHLNGAYQGHPNHANFTRLAPGDILVCHNKGGGYGYFTHAAVYVGDGFVVESYDFARGTILSPVSHLRNYDLVEGFRVKAKDTVRNAAAALALAEVGKPYDFLGALSDGSNQYCSKLAWRVYAANGIQLGAPLRWFLPDDVVRSREVYRVF